MEKEISKVTNNVTENKSIIENAKTISNHAITHFEGKLFDKAMAIVKALVEFDVELNDKDNFV